MKSSSPTGGNYPIEQRAGEVERLRIQADAMAFDAAVMLDRIELEPHWRCLDLGCGGGGITDLLSQRLGAGGHVLGLDRDEVALHAARAWAAASGIHNVEFVSGDAYATGFDDGAFDLVHARFLLGTSGREDELLAEAIRVTRPGGVVAIEEPDVDHLGCHPAHPAFARLKALLIEGFAAVGADVKLARRVYQMLRAAGLADVGYRPFVVGVRSSDPMVDYLPQTIESMRGVLIERARLVEPDELDALLRECRAHLARPDVVFTSYLVAQVWGRRPGG